MTRFRKEQLYDLIERLLLPPRMRTDNGLRFPSEHGILILLYHTTYPTKLLRMQKIFGREYSQLSRIENSVKDFLIEHNRHKVVCNLENYSLRFNDYAAAHNRAFAYSAHNPVPSTVPEELLNIIGSIDGSSFPIARIQVTCYIYIISFIHAIFILYLLYMLYLYCIFLYIP
jgi:hypothetical protein